MTDFRTQRFKCAQRTKDWVMDDFWTTSERCSYCGSMSEDTFFSFLDLGWPVTAEKEKSTFAFNEQQYFVTTHLSIEGREKIIKYYNEGKICVLNKSGGKECPSGQ